MNTINEPVAFLVKQADIAALFSEMELQCNEGSAFYRANAGSVADTDIRAVYGELLADQDFLRACRIIAQPDLYVTTRAAGTQGLSETRLHRKKTEGDWAVLIETVEDDGILLTAFPDYRAYLGAWTEDFAGAHDATTANYIPPRVSLEEFLFALHTVDSFRRVSYQNMLDHAFMDRVYIRIPEFNESMANSVKSMDIRWLLPAFMAVTPGIERYRTNLGVENLTMLLNQDFFEEGKLASGEDVLVFGEAGQVMGVEFFHSWLFSCGFEINVAGTGNFQVVERLFIAPTVLTNHFVRLEEAEGGKAMVNHQAYTKEQLEIKLDELFSNAFSMEVAPVRITEKSSPAPSSGAAAVKRDATPSSSPAAVKRDAATSSVVPASKNAENSGGVPRQAKAATQGRPAAPVQTVAPAQAAPKFCRNCGSKINLGVAFCPSCGFKIK